MIAAFILIATVILLFLSYIDNTKDFKFLSKKIRNFILKNKKHLSIFFSIFIAILVFLDAYSDESNMNSLLKGQNQIFNEITLTQKKRDSIVNFYSSRLNVQGEELILAKNKIKELLDQLDYYNKSTDEVIKKSYNLFLNEKYEEAIKTLDGYAEKSTVKRLISIYKLKIDLYLAQARIDEALPYSEKLYYLEPSTQNKFEYAIVLFYSGKYPKSLELFKELDLELKENSDVLNLFHSFRVYYHLGRILQIANEPKLAMRFYLEAYEFINKSDNIDRVYYSQQLMNAMAGCLYDDKQYDLSENLFMKVVANFENSKCHSDNCLLLKSTAYMNLSNVIRVGKKDYDLSLKYLNKGKRILEKELNKNNSIYQLYSHCSFKFNEGMIYKEMKKFNNAEILFKQCLNLIPIKKSELGLEFSRLEIIANIQLSNLYKQTKQMEKFQLSNARLMRLNEEYKAKY